MSNKLNKFKGKSIAILYPHNGFLGNPTLVCLAEELLAAGAKVDVYSDPADSAGRVPGVRHCVFPTELCLWTGSPRLTLDIMRRWATYKKSGASFFREKYDLVLGANAEGLLAAERYLKYHPVPMVYLSFEIFYRDELTFGFDIKEKKREVLASQKADLVVVQDPIRGGLLCKENNLSENKIIYLPVAPRHDSRQLAKNVICNHFSIPEKNTVIVHSGGFGESTYADEIIESAARWPSDITLLIHVPPSRTYLNGIPELRSGAQVIFDKTLLDPAEYADLVMSADCGLVMYKPTWKTKYLGKNMEHIGLSSGKFSTYTNYGVPVIAVKQKQYQDLLIHYKFGEVVNTLDEIPAAAKRIAANRQYHNRESKRLFNEQLDFAVHWPQVREAFSALL